MNKLLNQRQETMIEGFLLNQYDGNENLVAMFQHQRHHFEEALKEELSEEDKIKCIVLINEGHNLARMIGVKYQFNSKRRDEAFIVPAPNSKE